MSQALTHPEQFDLALDLAREAQFAEKGGAFTVALERYQQARDLIAELSPTPLLANLFRWIGSVQRDLGETAGADRSYRESLRIAELTGTTSGQAAALNCQAVMAQR